jgi:enterochelin esterase-like enzyme
MKVLKPLALGVILGLATTLPPVSGLYRALAGRFEIDPERLQLIAALGLAVLLALAVSAVARSIRPGVITGAAAVLTGVLLPAVLMATTEAPPQGLRWQLDVSRLLSNEAVLAASAGCLVVLGAAIGRLRLSSLRAPRPRHAVVVIALLATGATVARPAIELALFGPTYKVHHLLMPVAIRVPAQLVSSGTGIVPPSCPPGPSTLSEIRVPSPALGADRAALVQLPAGYPKCAPTGGYPVVYLLHGDPGGMHGWPSIGSQEVFDAGHSSGLGAFVVVYPDGAGPWTDWSDSADGSWRMGTFIANDLVGYIDHNYTTAASPKRRFIGGLSSGGFGAASLAVSHPRVFGGFLGFSGYYRTGLRISSSRALPPGISPDRLAVSPEAASMHVVIGTGLQDGAFTEEAVRYRDQLRAAGVEMEYIEKPGGHGGHLWRDLLWTSLPTLAQWIAPAPQARPRQ